ESDKSMTAWIVGFCQGLPIPHQSPVPTINRNTLEFWVKENTTKISKLLEISNKLLATSRSTSSPESRQPDVSSDEVSKETPISAIEELEKPTSAVEELGKLFLELIEDAHCELGQEPTE